MDVEANLARNIARRSLWVGPLLVAIFAITRGAGGAAASALGVAVIVGNFLLSGAMLSAAARRSLNLYHAAALFGFLLRLGLITATLFVIAWAVDVDRLALGVSAIAGYLVLLTLESLAVMRTTKGAMKWSG